MPWRQEPLLGWLCDRLLGNAYVNMLVTTQWPLKRAATSPHLSGFVFYGCLESLMELSALCFDRIRNSMKIQNALVSNILDRSQRYFAHVTTVTLSWRVKNIVVIGRVYFTLECFEFSWNFEFDRNMLSGTGARSDLLWSPKWPRNWAFEAHIVYISESSRHEHIKQDWCRESRAKFNKANLRDLIAATGLVILLKLDLNRRFFSPCDLEIWWMTPKNNRAPLLCYFKLFASFLSHWWIQTGVTVRKRLIWVNFDAFLSRVTLKFDGWPSKTIGHLFYAI